MELEGRQAVLGKCKNVKGAEEVSGCGRKYLRRKETSVAENVKGGVRHEENVEGESINAKERGMYNMKGKRGGRSVRAVGRGKWVTPLPLLIWT